MFLIQSVIRAAQINSTGAATVYGNRRRNWGEFKDRISRLAAALLAIGIKKGDRVCMLSPNSDRYLEYYYGVPWAGGVIVPLNNRWSLNELGYAIEDSGATVLLVDESFIDMATKLVANLPELKQVVILSESEPGDQFKKGQHCYERLLATATPVSPVSRSPTDLYGIFYTGGTTGKPKGVMLSTIGLWANAMYIVAALGYKPGCSMLHAGPLFHMATGSSVFAITNAAATHIIIETFNTRRVLEAVSSERITHLVLVPTMLKLLLEDPEFYQFDLSSLEKITYGAAPISESLVNQLGERLPQVKLFQAFGQTEMSPIISFQQSECNDPAHPLFSKRNSVGQAANSTELGIVDTEGSFVSAGESGEIIARGPGVMLGYWNKEDQTKATLVDGWVKTGDAGYLDEDGYLYLQDRVKDMIISGGENVYSIEVENAVLKHADVTACAVIGVPDDKWGERVHAVIELAGERQVAVEELREHCRQYIAGYKCPVSVEIVDALPLSPAGKILKTELRKPHWEDNSLRKN